MASPFPGMDPYLEQFWRGVHASLIIYARDMLQERLPGDLRARVEERVFVESNEGQRVVSPDIRVVERGQGPRTGGRDIGLTVAEPLVIHLSRERVSETFIEIIEVGSARRVVTVIEVLSLANKLPGEGQELYRRKQRELVSGRVSLFEIDLLRAGRRVLSVPDTQIPRSHRTIYQVCVRRGSRPDSAEIYRVPLRERLPAIRIPLREHDADVALDLQTLMDQCYRNGGYNEDIDYTSTPEPPLDPDDARWADELLRSTGRR